MNLLLSLLPFIGLVSATTGTFSNATKGAECACTRLSNLKGTQLLYQSSENYTQEATDYWDVRANASPSCIFMPKNANDVAQAMTIFSGCQAQFAVRGGGHMDFPGSNNINDGVLLAFNLMQELTVNETAQTIAYGSGTRWVDVYGALEPYGLYCVGGRMKTIGSAGLTLIGGWHYLNNKYGYAMDNVISYDVVLGNGTEVVASKQSNPDLFWALKGGAVNFGIVTRFLVQAHKIPQISTTIQSFSEDQIEPFVKATCHLASNDDPSIGAGAVISISYNTTTKSASGSLLGVQEGTESPPSRFERFSAIKPVSRIDAVQTPAKWHSVLETPNQMFRAQYFHGTMRPDAKRLYDIYLAWKESVSKLSDVEGLYPTFVMNIMPKSAQSVAKRNGVGNIWGLDDKESFVIWQTSTGWARPEDDLRVSGWAAKFKDYHHSVNHQMGLASDFIYMGDASETQNPWLGIPFKNVEKLRQIRAKYDPEGVFTILNWGGYKLGH